MNETTISLVSIALLVTSSMTGAAAASLSVGTGASMEPTLCDGSLVLLDRDATPHAGDIVVAQWRDATLQHRVRGFDGRHVNLTGDNTTSLDRWNVEGTNRTIDYRDKAGAYARPLRKDIVGVVDLVLYDGCGPL
jgi:signal peptidase I